MSLKFISFNVHYNTETLDECKTILRYIESHSPDFICLQEVNVFLLELLRTHLHSRYTCVGKLCFGQPLDTVTAAQITAAGLHRGIRATGIKGIHADPIFVSKRHTVEESWSLYPLRQDVSSPYILPRTSLDIPYYVTVNVCRVITNVNTALTMANTHLDTKHPKATLLSLLTGDLFVTNLDTDDLVFAGDFNMNSRVLDEVLGKCVEFGPVLNRATDLCDVQTPFPAAKQRGGRRGKPPLPDEIGRVCHYILGNSWAGSNLKNVRVNVEDVNISDHNAVVLQVDTRFKFSFEIGHLNRTRSLSVNLKCLMPDQHVIYSHSNMHAVSFDGTAVKVQRKTMISGSTLVCYHMLIHRVPLALFVWSESAPIPSSVQNTAMTHYQNSGARMGVFVSYRKWQEWKTVTYGTWAVSYHSYTDNVRASLYHETVNFEIE